MSVKDILLFGTGTVIGGVAGATVSQTLHRRAIARKPSTPKLSKPKALWRKVTILSTWRVECGIAKYTEYLTSSLQEIRRLECEVIPVDAIPSETETQILHWQHEHGVAPEQVSIPAPLTILTLHNVNPQLDGLDRIADAYIVHTQAQFDGLKPYTRKPIYLIPHGSKIIPHIAKEEALEMLELVGISLPRDKRIVYSHGIGEGKNYEEVLLALRALPDTFFVILASSTFKPLARRAVEQNIPSYLSHARKLGMENRVKVIGKWVDDDLIDLLALSSDCLVFNYATPPAFGISVSGALHRILSASKPIVCSRNDLRLSELEEDVHAKMYDFGDVDAMRSCFESVLSDKEEAEWLGNNCRQLAYRTSWEQVAVMHLETYDSLWAKVV